jgi:RNA polymerase sigma factor (TIGR02999 family)
MRRILIERARHRQRRKHGGDLKQVKMRESELVEAARSDELLALDDALTKLAAEDATAAEVVKLRFYGGLSVEEAASALGISRANAYRHWSYARAWLRCALRDGDSSPAP